MSKEKTETDENQHLYDPTNPPSQIIKVECKKCNHIDKPYKWKVRFFIGILYFFLILGPISLLIYFGFTEPYICPKCGERNQLVKILNNDKRVPQESLSKITFLGISILLVPFLVVFVLFVLI